jgi:hypothetical protein
MNHKNEGQLICFDVETKVVVGIKNSQPTNI